MRLPASAQEDRSDTDQRPSRFGSAAALNLAGQAFPVFVAVLTTPMIVRLLGPAGFGVIALVWSLAGYLTLLDLGLGRAVAKLGAEANALPPARLRGLVAQSLRMQMIFGAVTGLVLFLLCPQLAALLHVPPAMEASVANAFRILAVIFPLILVTTTYRGALEALQDFRMVNFLRSVFGSLIFLVTLLGAWLTDSVVFIVLLIAVVRVAAAASHWAAFNRAVPRAEPDVHTDTSSLLAFGSWVTATSLLVPLVQYLDRFLVGATLGLAAVAHYAGPYELAMKLMLLPGAVASALLPMMSGQASRGRRTDQQLRQAMWLSALLMVVPAIVLVWAAGPITSIWLGQSYVQPSSNVLRLLTLAVFFNGLALLPFTALEARGRPDLVTKYHLCELPVYVLVLVLLIGRWGINGAAFAWVIRNAVGFAALLWLAGRAHHHDGRHVARSSSEALSSAESLP
ncbi:MAG: flippase [Gemmatimonadota bacterium]